VLEVGHGRSIRLFSDLVNRVLRPPAAWASFVIPARPPTDESDSARRARPRNRTSQERRVPLVDRYFEWLRQGPVPDVDRTIAVALPHAEPDYRDRLYALLVERDHPASWGALLSDFPSLSAPLKKLFTDDPHRLVTALPAALRLPHATGRRNALLAAELAPTPALALPLSDALRDPAKEVRDLAGALLGRLAAVYVRTEFQRTRPRSADEQRAHEQLVTALGDALKSFDRHWCLEPVRAALWFAADLGPRLWDVLSDAGGRVTELVRRHLDGWDDPRLAPFLLTGLTRPRWNKIVAPRLRKWHGRGALEALVLATGLLEEPELRTALAEISQPRWFEGADGFIAAMSPERRASLPRWLCVAALPERDRTQLLGRWLHFGCPALQRGCVYALAHLRTPDAPARFAEVAGGDGPLADFARWWLAGRNAQTSAPPYDARRQDNRPVNATDEALFGLVWETTRLAPGDDQPPLVELLAQHFQLWPNLVLRNLTGAAAADRLLALRVLGNEGLAAEHAPVIQRLLSDPDQGVRDRARAIMRSLARQRVSGDWPTAPPAPPPSTTIGAHRPVDAVRGDLLAIARELLSNAKTRVVPGDRVERLELLLEEYRGARREAAMRQTASAAGGAS
jgi:hypothetical protein